MAVPHSENAVSQDLEAVLHDLKKPWNCGLLIDARLSTGKSRPGNDVSDITSRHVPGSQMRDVTESLMMLCEQASKEQDSEKLSNLVEDIIRLLAEKQRLEEMETLLDVSLPN